MRQLITTFLFFILCSVGFSQVPVSETGKFYDYNGTKIYYEDIGQGEPLLLLHNFNGTADSWKPYFESYSKHFRVIAVDMIGHGRSDIYKKDDVEFKHGEYANIVLALMDYLHIDTANAIGASAGGMTLLYANYMKPNKFKNVITVGAQIYIDKRVREWIIADGSDSAKPAYLERASKNHGYEKALLQARQFWQFRRAYGDPAFTPDMLNLITANWLIVHGDNDFIPLDQALEMKQHIPNSRLWIFPNGGHLPHLRQANITDFTQRSTEFLLGKWNKK
ncbi:MAG: alpha/beta hydrolase [Ignavibacteriae bacterium]|nr:alpha/beta hydrolase [Ignavibacteriota bacterium]